MATASGEAQDAQPTTQSGEVQRSDSASHRRTVTTTRTTVVTVRSTDGNHQEISRSTTTTSTGDGHTGTPQPVQSSSHQRMTSVEANFTEIRSDSERDMSQRAQPEDEDGNDSVYATSCARFALPSCVNDGPCVPRPLHTRDEGGSTEVVLHTRGEMGKGQTSAHADASSGGHRTSGDTTSERNQPQRSVALHTRSERSSSNERASGDGSAVAQSRRTMSYHEYSEGAASPQQPTTSPQRPRSVRSVRYDTSPHSPRTPLERRASSRSVMSASSATRRRGGNGMPGPGAYEAGTYMSLP